MKTGAKLGLIFGGVILLLGLVFLVTFVGISMFNLFSGTDRSRATYKKQTAETVGTITNVSLTTSSKIYTYKYDVNGVSYSATYTSGRSQSGGSVPLIMSGPAMLIEFGAAVATQTLAL